VAGTAIVPRCFLLLESETNWTVRSGATRAAFGGELNHDVVSPIGASSEDVAVIKQSLPAADGGSWLRRAGKTDCCMVRRLTCSPGLATGIAPVAEPLRGPSSEGRPAARACMRNARSRLTCRPQRTWMESTPAVLSKVQCPQTAACGHFSVSQCPSWLMKGCSILATADSGAAVPPGVPRLGACLGRLSPR
jgi:hypothetical protein